MNLKATTLRNWTVRLKRYGLQNTMAIFLNQKRDGLYRLRYQGMNFLLRGRSVDFQVFNSIFGNDEYGVDFGFLPEYIVDAGAFSGFSALYFQKRFPDALIIAIEPESSNFELLTKNTEPFRKILTLKGGIYGKEMKLSIADTHAEKYAFRLEEGAEDEGSVTGFTIARLMRDFSLPRIDILKMDVEGAEFSVFMNNPEEWLSSVRMIIAELHEYLHPGVSELMTDKLRNAGFSLDRRGENIIARRTSKMS